MEFEFIKLSDIEYTPPAFPKVVKRRHKLWLVLEDGREYEVPADPIKVLGLLHHFAGKVWADHGFFYHAIARIANARGWQIHPC